MLLGRAVSLDLRPATSPTTHTVEPAHGSVRATRATQRVRL